jgi:hypothetical protein
MSGSSEGAPEGAAEVAFAQIQQLRQILDANPFVEVAIDVRCQPPLLPRHQPTAYDFSGAALRRAQSCRYRAGLTTKQRDRAGDVGFDGFAVTIARKACRFHEPCGYR